MKLHTNLLAAHPQNHANFIWLPPSEMTTFLKVVAQRRPFSDISTKLGS